MDDRHSSRFRAIGLTFVLATLCCTLSLLLLDGASRDASAQSPRLQGQGTAASGMGNAFTAQADDASAIHYNPAGMTQLHGIEVMVGTMAIGGSTDFVNNAGQTARSDRNGTFAWPAPSHLYIAARLQDLGVTALGDLSLGLGVNNPFGSITRSPNDGPYQSVSRLNALPLIDIKPTLAYRVNDQLAFGLGADIYTFSSMFGEGHAEYKFGWPGGSGIPAGTPMEFNGKDTAAGFNVSMLYTPFRNDAGLPLVNIGLVYRSQATLHLDGNFLANGAKIADAQSTLVLPQVYSLGVALWPVRTPSREWKLEFDLDYVGWKSVRNLDVRLSTGSVLPQPKNWESGYTVMIGTEYRFRQIDALPGYEIALRAGYQGQQAQMPNSTFDPGIAAANTHIPSIGIGFLCKEGGRFLGMFACGGDRGGLRPQYVAVDLSYPAVFYEDRTILGNIRPEVNGRYSTFIHAAGMGIRMGF